jgi:hypothetical protein
MPPRRQGARRKPQGGQGKQSTQVSDDEHTLPSAGEDVSKLIPLTGSPVPGQNPSTERADQINNNKLLTTATNALCLEDNSSPLMPSPTTGEAMANTTTLLNSNPEQGMNDEKDNKENGENKTQSDLEENNHRNAPPKATLTREDEQILRRKREIEEFLCLVTTTFLTTKGKWKMNQEHLPDEANIPLNTSDPIEELKM